MLRRRPRLRVLFAGLVLVLVSLTVGIVLGGNAHLLPGPVRDTLVGDREGQLVQRTIDMIERSYYRPVSREQLVDSGIAGMVSSLDDKFSHYFDPSTYARFQQSTDPRFSGIGVTVQGVARGLRVTRVIADTPAERAGLRRGDVIVAVGRRLLAGHPSDYGVGLVKGEPGTKVRLTIERRGRRFVKAIERAEIVEPVVEGRVERTRSGTYGVVVFTSFTSNSSDQVRAEVDRLLERGVDGIVLDLRGNGGGLLGEAVETASIFIPDGTVVSTDGRARRRHVFTATGGAIDPEVPVVVLVDRGTASASEIVAGALKDRDRATIVGTRTYGKGVFQEVRELPNGGALDLTVGQYFLPSGDNLGGRGVSEGDGIAPDVRAVDDPDTRRDEALDAALRTLADGTR